KHWGEVTPKTSKPSKLPSKVKLGFGRLHLSPKEFQHYKRIVEHALEKGQVSLPKPATSPPPKDPQNPQPQKRSYDGDSNSRSSAGEPKKPTGGTSSKPSGRGAR